MTKSKKKQLERDTELRGNIEWQNQTMMLFAQILQHWGALTIRQDGSFAPVFDSTRNMPCAWVDTPGKCTNKECNWCPEQCIFTGKFDQCKYYLPMIDPKDVDTEEYHTVKTPDDVPKQPAPDKRA